MTTVDVYVRVSRVGGREHLQSPEDQEHDARAFAKTQGLEVGKVLIDLNKSGGTIDRPAFAEALARVESGESAGIVVAYLSRATRDVRQGLDLLERITRAGGVVYAPNLPDYTTADGRMLTTIQLAIDTGYLERKRDELERSKRGAIEAGIPVSNRSPVGYRKQNRRLVPVPKTASVIREVFERRAAGAGPSELADFLKSRGVRTSQGSRSWSKQAVMAIIRSRVYLGEISYGKDRDDEGNLRPRYVNANAHEPIVDLATWTAAQHPNGRHVQPPRGEGRYSLSGVLRCAACGYSMQATTHRGKRLYRCVRRHAGGTCPTPARIFADEIETKAEELFWHDVNDLTARREPEAEDLAPLKEVLAKAELRLEQALSPSVQDAAGDAWGEMVRERREARDRAAQALGEAKARQRVTPLPDAKTLRGIWQDLSPSERRELYAAHWDMLALRRDGRMLDLFAFLEGTAPEGLSRRGFNREPQLRPIDCQGDYVPLMGK